MADALQGVSPWLAVTIVVTFLTFVTEVTSNTAITALTLPLLLSTAVGLGIDPRLLLLPATIAASCAFMFPIATPPNAVVFASGKVSMGDMARAGMVCNLLSILLLSVVMWLWVLPWLGVGTGRPAWLR
jgi:sodium-dependent dicarboxylate transporter 2/3/5